MKQRISSRITQTNYKKIKKKRSTLKFFRQSLGAHLVDMQLMLIKDLNFLHVLLIFLEILWKIKKVPQLQLLFKQF